MKRVLLLPDDKVADEIIESSDPQRDVLLPLLLKGVARVVHTPNYLDLGALISYDALYELGDRADMWVGEFVRMAGGGESPDGIDWFQACFEDNQLYFMRNAALAHALVNRFNTPDFGSVVWCGQSDYPEWDMAQGLLGGLRDGLGTKFQLSNLGLAPVNRNKSSLVRRIRTRAARMLSVKLHNERLPPRAKVVALFALREGDRFTEPLTELYEQFGDALQVWHLGALWTELQAWAQERQLRIWDVPMPERAGAEMQKFFQARWQAWQNETGKEFASMCDAPLLHSNAVRAYFRWLFTYTLPRLAEWGRVVQRWLENAQPEWLIGSAATTQTSIMPFLVGRALGVKTLALSHTYFSGDFSPVTSEWLACRNLFERNSYRKSCPEDERVVYCSNAVNRLTYKTTSRAEFNHKTGLRVALVTGSATVPKFWLPWLNIDAFYKMLGTVAQPPSDLDTVQFWFKGHPRFDMSHVLHDFALRPNFHIYPASESIHMLLEHADVIVLCGAMGSVFADAITTGKPLVFFNSAQVYFPRLDTTPYRAGVVVTEQTELWQELRRLRDEPDYSAVLRRRNERFREQYLTRALSTLGVQLRQLSDAS